MPAQASRRYISMCTGRRCVKATQLYTDPEGKSCGAGLSSKKQNRGAVRGAKNGKLLPGEKKRLKREKMTAKRAVRASSSGVDLESINAQLVQFVATDGDMKVRQLCVILPCAVYWLSIASRMLH